MGLRERRLGLAAYWSGRLQDALAHYDMGLEAARASGATAQEARLLLARATCPQELGMPVDAQREVEDKEIGTALGISSRTVGTHLSNIFEKLGVSSRGELADVVREHTVARGGAV